MTTTNPVPQFDLQQTIVLLRKPGVGPAVLAAFVVLLGLLLPFVSISTNIGMGMDQSGSINGFQASTWAAWLLLIVALAAVASWFVIQLAPFRMILAYAVAVLGVVAIIVGWFFNPVAGELAQVNSALAGMGGPNMVSFGPNAGMVLVLLGAVVSGFNGFRARAA